jgi:hypothetical protein
MPSVFTWLDYSESERRKMLDVIELFGERVTRDELGLAGVRDAFADKLFPGTSTIQTRARYFLFVPWIFQIAEERRWKSAVVGEKTRRLEVQLIHALGKSEEHAGVIGIRAKENVRRLASSVYWQGLATWAIRKFPGSQDDYFRSLDGFQVRHRVHEQSSREFDGESLRGEGLANWHVGLPPRPVEFPDQASFTLTPAEADYLREQILHHCSDSLLAWFVRDRVHPEGVNFVWDLDLTVPANLAEWINHGRNFSEVLHGAALLYNLMLAQAADWSEREEDYQAEMTEWWATIDARWDTLKSWDRQRFWMLVLSQNPRIHSRARHFIDSWIDIVIAARGLEHVTAGKSARNLVHLREKQLKGGLARLDNLRARELWQNGGGAAGADQLDLRWRSAQRFLADLTKAWG